MATNARTIFQVLVGVHMHERCQESLAICHRDIYCEHLVSQKPRTGQDPQAHSRYCTSARQVTMHTHTARSNACMHA